MTKGIKVQAAGVGAVYLDPEFVDIDVYKEGDELSIYQEDIVNYEGNGYHLINSACGISKIEEVGDLVIVTVDIGEGPHYEYVQD